jgi:hypothetical protein
MHKICCTCKGLKLFSEFAKSKNKRDGYSSQCKTCVKSYYQANKEKFASRMVEYQKANKEQKAVYNAKYREDNKEKIAEYLSYYGTEYRQANKDKIAIRMSEYRQTNKDKINTKTAKRRAIKLQALPKWLTKEELEQIKELYTCAQMFKLYTGQEYHVDHIVPLQGENVCGLHVPWNLQILPAKENMIKSNKLQEDIL